MIVNVMCDDDGDSEGNGDNDDDDDDEVAMKWRLFLRRRVMKVIQWEWWDDNETQQLLHQEKKWMTNENHCLTFANFVGKLKSLLALAGPVTWADIPFATAATVPVNIAAAPVRSILRTAP